MTPRVVVIAGPTATGKSGLAVALARRFGGEIVNADSQQVYRNLDIGTAKPTEKERGGVPHHLFDVAEPWDQLDAARFVALADSALAAIAERGRPAFVVGGTGLWIRALLKGLVDAPGRDDAIRTRLKGEADKDGLAALHARLQQVDPEYAASIQPSDPIRIIRALEVFEIAGVPLSRLHAEHRAQPPRIEALQLALDVPREVLAERIRIRVEAMYAQGLLTETRAVTTDPRVRERLDRVIGYHEALLHLDGKLTLPEAIERTAIAQRQYARRQRTWFKAEPEWTWLDPSRTIDDAASACVRAGLREVA